MHAGRQKGVFATGIDADATGDGFRVKGFRAAVAGDGDGFETDSDRAAFRILHGHREIAKYAAADAVSLGVDGDRLGHSQFAIGSDLDIRIVAADVFLRSSRKVTCQSQDKSENKAPKHQRPPL
ncbi:hypothetical protein D3C73_769540 [compost metagenome]